MHAGGGCSGLGTHLQMARSPSRSLLLLFSWQQAPYCVVANDTWKVPPERAGPAACPSPAPTHPPTTTSLPFLPVVAIGCRQPACARSPAGAHAPRAAVLPAEIAKNEARQFQGGSWGRAALVRAAVSGAKAHTRGPPSQKMGVENNSLAVVLVEPHIAGAAVGSLHRLSNGVRVSAGQLKAAVRRGDAAPRRASRNRLGPGPGAAPAAVGY